MSQENVEIVRRAFDNLHSGDADRAEALAKEVRVALSPPLNSGPAGTA